LRVCGRVAYPKGAKPHTRKMRFFYNLRIEKKDLVFIDDEAAISNGDNLVYHPG